ncbi:MAG: hypothetical protein AAFX50_11245, partial [Acidobacteriota bacterium]
KALELAVGCPVRTVSLRDAGAPPGEDERVCRELGLGSGGALLIRPDGHVARRWRGAGERRAFLAAGGGDFGRDDRPGDRPDNRASQG